jgi:xylan 1,4-beta-xylosidase
MRWDADGWLRTMSGDGLPDPKPPAPDLPPAPWQDESWDGRFSDTSLPADLQWLRTPHSDMLFSLTARPGFLRLYGRETVGSHFTQALVARRQQHFRYSATTALEFAPANFQQAAGLICYYNSTKFHYLHVTRDEDVRQLQLMTASPDTGRCEMTLIEADLPSGAIELRAEVNYDELRFAWRGEADGDWRTIPRVLDASILSDEATLNGLPNFTGAFVGMACQDMAGTAAPADFAFFRYEGEEA